MIHTVFFFLGRRSSIPHTQNLTLGYYAPIVARVRRAVSGVHAVTGGLGTGAAHTAFALAVGSIEVTTAMNCLPSRREGAPSPPPGFRNRWLRRRAERCTRTCCGTDPTRQNNIWIAQIVYRQSGKYLPWKTKDRITPIRDRCIFPERPGSNEKDSWSATMYETVTRLNDGGRGTMPLPQHPGTPSTWPKTSGVYHLLLERLRPEPCSAVWGSSIVYLQCTVNGRKTQHSTAFVLCFFSGPLTETFVYAATETRGPIVGHGKQARSHSAPNETRHTVEVGAPFFVWGSSSRDWGVIYLSSQKKYFCDLEL